MDNRVACCVWELNESLVTALDDRLGIPTDSYVNGAQTWLLSNGPSEITLEWRLHPAPNYTKPPELSHYDIWEAAVSSAIAGNEIPQYWDALEAFPAYDDEVEPAVLAKSCADVLGVTPHVFGMVDHEAVSQAWEKSGGNISVLSELTAQF